MAENIYGIIILAAGASSRLGTAKQQLKYNNETLLQHSLKAALQSGAGQVVLVLGAKTDIMEAGIAHHKLTVVENPHWQQGMASSIRAGLNSLLAAEPGATAALIMVCDQPFVNASLVDNLLSLHAEGNYTIVASRYENTTGVPALFDKSLFPELLALEGDAGAKKLLVKHAASVVTVNFPMGSIDIDTITDYERLQKMG